MAKRKYKKKALPVRLSIMATYERSQHLDGVTTEIIDRDPSGRVLMERHRARSECVLDSYLYRELITQLEHEAGMKFRRAYLRAVLKIKVEDPVPGGDPDPHRAMLMKPESERIVREAFGALTLPQKAVIEAVCGHNDWAGGGDRLQTLHRGLERLIDVFHL